MIGEQAFLLVASDSDLRFLNPYKSHESSVNRVSATPLHKMDSMDALWAHSLTRVFWADHQQAKISSMQVSVPTGGRIARDAQLRESKVLVSTGLLL